jgi:hypothetical protein
MSIKMKKPNIKGDFTTLSAAIYVIVEASEKSVAQAAPKFMNTPETFFIGDHLRPNDLARNVSIFVNEDDALSSSNSGFVLELFYANMTRADDLFELMPSYGLGHSVSTLKLKKSLNGGDSTKVDLIVS